MLGPRAREARMKSWLFFRWYGTDHHGRNNASPRCQARVCNESDCWPDTYWRQPLPHVTLPGSLARPARHLLARGLGRGEVRFRRSENAPRCIPAPMLVENLIGRAARSAKVRLRSNFFFSWAGISFAATTSSISFLTAVGGSVNTLVCGSIDAMTK